MNIFCALKQEKIYGIIREDDPIKAYELANAYIEGGIKFIELNSPLEVTKRVSDKFRDVILAQGGIITMAQAHKALENGAKIIASPIFQDNLVRFASCYKAFLIPSVTTPNEAYSAWRARMPLIKVYPVAQMGGVSYIKDLIKPMPFLNLMPTGFVKLDEINEYLKTGVVAVGVGREFYNKKEYKDIVLTIKETLKSLN